MASSTATAKLPARIAPGSLNFPGPTPQKSKTLVEVLLEQDRELNHCFTNDSLFHNHLSHHVLAAFDMGASDTLLQTIYDEEAKDQRSITVKTDRTGPPPALEITSRNWTIYIGYQGAYHSYLRLFSHEILHHGPGYTLDKYVFSSEANIQGLSMLSRFLGGALHPMIQTGYGTEFRSEAMVAQGLAQAACTPIFGSEKLYEAIIYDMTRDRFVYPTEKLTALEILRRFYDADELTPPMPYNPNALLTQRFKETYTPERLEALQQIIPLWSGTVEDKLEDLTWLATLFVVACGKPKRKPRLDFFLMHVLNSTVFLPSMLSLLDEKDKHILLNAHLATTLLLALVRGRPRVDPPLVMSYTNFPRPPNTTRQASSDAVAPHAPNPWPAILEDVIHATDCHTTKCIRALYAASLKYGMTPAGSVRGAFKAGLAADYRSPPETHTGSAMLDGSLFIRAAGVVMDTLGWVSHGQKGAEWDRSALGWDEAWDNEGCAVDCQDETIRSSWRP